MSFGRISHIAQHPGSPGCLFTKRYDVPILRHFKIKSHDTFVWNFLFVCCRTACTLQTDLKLWTHCALMTTNVVIEVNTGSGNGWLPHGTKSFPQPMFTYHLSGPVALIWWQLMTVGNPQPSIISNHLSKFSFKSNSGQWVNIQYGGVETALDLTLRSKHWRIWSTNTDVSINHLILLYTSLNFIPLHLGRASWKFSVGATVQPAALPEISAGPADPAAPERYRWNRCIQVRQLDAAVNWDISCSCVSNSSNAAASPATQICKSFQTICF